MTNYPTKTATHAFDPCRSSVVPEGSVVPAEEVFPNALGGLDPCLKARSDMVRLDGRIARRFPGNPDGDYVVWDVELKGFGLRIRPSGTRTWFVKARVRGKQRKRSLGRVGEVDAGAARVAARAFLVDVALDGLPRPSTGTVAPLFEAYVEEFWTDYARHWKPRTQSSNRGIIRRELLPAFGAMPLDSIAREDIMRWRDGFAERQGVFNRALPVLAIMMGYAEQLGYRRKGSNPCRRMPRYKRLLPERFLSPLEYRRLAAALAEEEGTHPYQVAALRLLVLTGARSGEIMTLRWSWVQPGRLILPDSKTGPKIVWLNPQAEAVLREIPRRDGVDLVFPNRRGSRPVLIDNYWHGFRRRCLLPDVRIHDLRHSFASTGVMAGVPLALIGKLLGHALHETTARYAHLADDSVAEAAQRVCSSLATCLGFRQ